MRRIVSIVAVCAFAVVAAAVLRADEKPTEAYQKAMKDLGAANQALRTEVKTIESAGAYPDFTPIAKYVATMRPALTLTLAYWTEKKADDAIASTKAALKGVDDLEKAGKDKSYDSLVAASTAIGGTCGACHKAHRTQTPEGTYEIK